MSGKGPGSLDLHRGTPKGLPLPFSFLTFWCWSPGHLTWLLSPPRTSRAHPWRTYHVRAGGRLLVGGPSWAVAGTQAQRALGVGLGMALLLLLAGSWPLVPLTTAPLTSFDGRGRGHGGGKLGPKGGEKAALVAGLGSGCEAPHLHVRWQPPSAPRSPFSLSRTGAAFRSAGRGTDHPWQVILGAFGLFTSFQN